MFYGPMLKGLAPPKMLRLERGRCLRHRLSSSGCRRCFMACANGALSWNDDGLCWDERKCSGCLLCAAGCPTGAIVCNEFEIGSLLKRLDESDNPLLACTAKTQAKGHARIPCLGLLANPELLLGLRLASGKELKLNLTACAECGNRRVVEALRRSVDRLELLSGDPPLGIRLIDRGAELGYEERDCTRRDFFNLLKKRSTQAGMSFAGRLQDGPGDSAYGEKTVPGARRLIVRLSEQPGAAVERIEKLFPVLQMSDACDGCGSCPGICPTGALEAGAKDGEAPSHDAKRCVACGLCAEFCPRAAIALSSQPSTSS